MPVRAVVGPQMPADSRFYSRLSGANVAIPSGLEIKLTQPSHGHRYVPGQVEDQGVDSWIPFLALINTTTEVYPLRLPVPLYGLHPMAREGVAG